MTQAYLDPGTTVNTLWTTNAYTNINKATRQPTAPSTGTYADASKSDAGEKQQWGFTGSSLTNINITSITMWANGKGDSITPPAPKMSVYVNGAYLTDSTEVLNTSSQAWYSYTWNGTWNAQNVNNMKMAITCTPNTVSIGCDVYCAYLDITYTDASSGQPTKARFGLCKNFNLFEIGRTGGMIG